jgi:5-methylcytosine-specific restriction protein A
MEIDLLTLDNSVKYDSWIYTKKKVVENAVGQYCFLIVGKTEKIKKYYLWTFFKVEDYEINGSGYYSVYGHGYDFEHPILLNELPNFNDFKHFCGNFGLGFQNIDNHIFYKTLLSFSSETHLSTSSNLTSSETGNRIEYLPTETAQFDGDEFLKEGKVVQVLVNRYERNQKARQECIRHYGDKCFICGFDFTTTYGDIAKGFIHVHHLTQLSDINQEYHVDPINDLIPVCANCHSVIHLTKPAMTIDELKELLKKSSR